MGGKKQPARTHITLQIDRADLAVINKARALTGHNRSAFFRHAALTKAADLIAESSQKRGGSQ